MHAITRTNTEMIKTPKQQLIFIKVKNLLQKWLWTFEILNIYDFEPISGRTSRVWAQLWKTIIIAVLTFSLKRYLPGIYRNKRKHCTFENVSKYHLKSDIKIKNLRKCIKCQNKESKCFSWLETPNIAMRTSGFIMLSSRFYHHLFISKIQCVIFACRYRCLISKVWVKSGAV